MRILASILLGYILAAPLTEKISLDLRLTEWTHLMTYFWWVFSGAIWALIFFAVFAAIAAAFGRR